MNYLKVNLWGNEIGRLVWNPAAKAAYFVYNPANAAALPDVAPLLSPAATRNIHLPIYGDTATLYQGLPPFIADSLPDSWGNTLFEIWAKENKIPRNKITPLYKLMFIGTRGMGALEYQPCASDLNHTRKIDISALYDLALKILDDRENIVLDTNEQLTMQALLAVGTSAGGRQTKAIIAINEATGEIRSGQSVAPDGFEYHIMKFGSREMPMAEIETAYYHMARTAGIEMEQCRLFPVEGINHFLTKRFDRKNGKKIHTQTLAAINPEAHSYEDLIATCRELSVTESEIKQIFVRMAFNVMACNTDDRNKNFSFLLEKGGQWRLAPAYDMTFIFNDTASGPNSERRMSIGGKTSAITKDDLIEIALQNGIKDAASILDRIATAINRFNSFADLTGIRQPWRGIIQNALTRNLTAFGYGEQRITQKAFDRYGRMISDISIIVNTKETYVISVMIDGRRHRRFIRKNTPEYAELAHSDCLNIPPSEQLRLIERLLPPV